MQKHPNEIKTEIMSAHTHIHAKLTMLIVIIKPIQQRIAPITHKTTESCPPLKILQTTNIIVIIKIQIANIEAAQHKITATIQLKHNAIIKSNITNIVIITTTTQVNPLKGIKLNTAIIPNEHVKQHAQIRSKIIHIKILTHASSTQQIVKFKNWITAKHNNIVRHKSRISPIPK